METTTNAKRHAEICADRALSHVKGEKVCHYMLDTGNKRDCSPEACDKYRFKSRRKRGAAKIGKMVMD